ncbi:sigma factor-like helix-turn-helix DNA-binding protein [Staphylococcus lugdunensis]|nr:LuxR C-terminal-related transcriptional regulator [Staphylococcus aureus]
MLQISGYKQYEIAQHMHVSLSSVKNYKRNARQKLQRFFT